MTRERFAALADAYGGDIGRWPEGEQKASVAYLLKEPEVRLILLRQARLDAALDAWAVPPPTARLSAEIAGNALNRHGLVQRVRIWLSSAGAAAALAGGVAAGMNMVAVSTPPQAPRTHRLYGLQVLGVPLDRAYPASLPGVL